MFQNVILPFLTFSIERKKSSKFFYSHPGHLDISFRTTEASEIPKRLFQIDLEQSEHITLNNLNFL